MAGRVLSEIVIASRGIWPNNAGHEKKEQVGAKVFLDE
jgi:hypothetical protein